MHLLISEIAKNTLGIHILCAENVTSTHKTKIKKRIPKFGKKSQTLNIKQPHRGLLSPIVHLRSHCFHLCVLEHIAMQIFTATAVQDVIVQQN